MPPVPCPDIFLKSFNREKSSPHRQIDMTTRRWIFFFLSLALGLGLGLFYGWVISPVQYIDTTPGTLRIDFQADYTLMVAEVFHSDQNIDLAGQRVAVLGSRPPAEIAAQALSFAQQNGYSPADVALLQNLVTALQVSQPVGAKP